jgi:hypothetical protein
MSLKSDKDISPASVNLAIFWFNSFYNNNKLIYISEIPDSYVIYPDTRNTDGDIYRINCYVKSPDLINFQFSNMFGNRYIDFSIFINNWGMLKSPCIKYMACFT